MKRKEFLKKGLASGALIGTASLAPGSSYGIQKVQVKDEPWGYDKSTGR